MPESRTGSGTPRTPAWGRFPSREFKINQTWLILTAIAADLVAWTRLLGCIDDAAALAGCEPKALRYRFLHVPARLTHRPTTPPPHPPDLALGGRRRRGLRQHRGHPTASLTRPSTHNLTTRRTAARQRQPATRRTCDHPEHERTRSRRPDTN